MVQKLSDKTRTLTAQHAEWFGREEKIVLYPPVHFEDTKGSSGDATGEVEVFTKEGDERYITKQSGTIQFRVDDEDEDQPKQQAKPASKRK